MAKAGRPLEFGRRIHVMLSPAIVAMLDKWRKRQPGKSTRSAAIRKAIEAMLGMTILAITAATLLGCVRSAELRIVTDSATEQPKLIACSSELDDATCLKRAVPPKLP